MTIEETYLISLQGKIFKLLPMREAFEQGEENHIDDFVKNLCSNLEGAFKCHPEFATYRELAEVQGNLWSLRTSEEVDFAQWRSTVLRSVRLIHSLLTKQYGG